MKVEEAREKVCPFIPEYTQRLDIDRIEVRHFNCYCKADKCMAWVPVELYSPNSISNKALSNPSEEGRCARL